MGIVCQKHVLRLPVIVSYSFIIAGKSCENASVANPINRKVVPPTCGLVLSGGLWGGREVEALYSTRPVKGRLSTLGEIPLRGVEFRTSLFRLISGQGFYRMLIRQLRLASLILRYFRIAIRVLFLGQGDKKTEKEKGAKTNISEVRIHIEHKIGNSD